MVEKLISRAQGGDAEAFGELYELFVEKIYRFYFYKVDTIPEAEDLTARVFEKALENLKKYKKGNFQAWLFRIAQNTLVDYWRKRKKERSLKNYDEKGEESILEKVCQKEEERKLVLALRKLKKEYNDVLTLRFFNQFSTLKIAEILGKSEGAVRVLQHRALKALKEVLEEK